MNDVAAAKTNARRRSDDDDDDAASHTHAVYIVSKPFVIHARARKVYLAKTI